MWIFCSLFLVASDSNSVLLLSENKKFLIRFWRTATDALYPYLISLICIERKSFCTWKLVLMGRNNILKRYWVQERLNFCFLISLILSIISFDRSIKLIQLNLSNWRVNTAVKLPYFDATRLFWMESQLCTSQSFSCHYSKKKSSLMIYDLSTRMISCPWTKLLTCKHYCKAFLFNQVHIFPLVIVTFTRKALAVPFIGMILQAPSCWQHVQLSFHSRSLSRWDDWC